jgi:endonuclease YncB( thermonuclease family)
MLHQQKKQRLERERLLSATQLPAKPTRNRPPWSRRRFLDLVKLGLIAVVLGAIAGLAIQAIFDPGLTDELKSTNLYVAVSSIGKPFGLCGTGFQADCVIDGNTIDYKGQLIRMADYDSPEFSEPKCPYEKTLGHKAKRRLLEFLNSGPIAVATTGDRDLDRDGRRLRLVTVSGLSVGNYLIGEGLAVPWDGHLHSWCQ